MQAFATILKVLAGDARITDITKASTMLFITILTTTGGVNAHTVHKLHTISIVIRWQFGNLLTTISDTFINSMKKKLINILQLKVVVLITLLKLKPTSTRITELKISLYSSFLFKKIKFKTKFSLGEKTK